MPCFCTLFNSAYLDKGIVTIESLKKVSPESYVYVFAFDDKCYEVLNDIGYDNVRPVSLKEFETDQLLELKKERSSRSYCWTCTPFIIKHVLEKCGEEQCTYIDADMYFYSDPQILLDEIDTDQCDVGIVEHRFGKGKVQEQQLEIAGRYCVEFNTFKNNKNGLEVLNWWADRCAECCTDDVSQSKDGKFGDQMYLNDWSQRFVGVHVMQNHGGGMAPWNVYRYRMEKIDEKGNIWFRDIQDKGSYQLCFYHFHGMTHYKDGTVNISVYGRYGHPQKKLVDFLYEGYIQKIKEVREMLYRVYHIDLNEKNQKRAKNSIKNVLHVRTYIKERKDIYM